MYRLYFTTFPTKSQGQLFRNHLVFCRKANVFRHRIFYVFQEYPLFQSATKSSFLDLCYSSRCHVHKTNKPQVGRSHPTRSLFWLGQYRTILSADTAAAARHLRCHLIAPFLPVHSLQRHLVTGLQIGQLAEVSLVIMSRNDQIFRICTAGIAADSIRCLFIANFHYNCRGEPYSSSLQ